LVVDAPPSLARVSASTLSRKRRFDDEATASTTEGAAPLSPLRKSPRRAVPLSTKLPADVAAAIAHYARAYKRSFTDSKLEFHGAAHLVDDARKSLRKLLASDKQRVSVRELETVAAVLLRGIGLLQASGDVLSPVFLRALHLLAVCVRHVETAPLRASARLDGSAREPEALFHSFAMTRHAFLHGFDRFVGEDERQALASEIAWFVARAHKCGRAWVDIVGAIPGATLSHGSHPFAFAWRFVARSQDAVVLQFNDERDVRCRIVRAQASPTRQSAK